MTSVSTVATIQIAGEIESPAHLDMLLDAIVKECAQDVMSATLLRSRDDALRSIEDASRRGARLRLYSLTARYGRFEAIEKACQASGLWYFRHTVEDEAIARVDATYRADTRTLCIAAGNDLPFEEALRILDTGGPAALAAQAQELARKTRLAKGEGMPQHLSLAASLWARPENRDASAT